MSAPFIAIVIPAYQDYKKRALVSELLEITKPIQKSIERNNVRKNTELDNLVSQANADSPYLEMLQVSFDGSIYLILSEDASNRIGKTLLLKPIHFDGEIHWKCISDTSFEYHMPRSCAQEMQ